MVYAYFVLTDDLLIHLF